jgi:hypothetical protein
MHQNLLNAAFASAWYINDNRENVKEMSVFKPLTKELLNSFCCTHACHNFIFGTMAFFQHKEGLI